MLITFHYRMIMYLIGPFCARNIFVFVYASIYIIDTDDGDGNHRLLEHGGR